MPLVPGCVVAPIAAMAMILACVFFVFVTTGGTDRLVVFNLTSMVTPVLVAGIVLVHKLLYKLPDVTVRHAAKCVCSVVCITLTV